MSTALDIGKKLVELCNTDKSMEAMTTLYSNDIVSVEAGAPANMSPRTDGLPGVLKKAEWWYANHEVHGGTCSGPWPHGDRFVVRFTYEVTPKMGPMAGKRMTIDEAALYTVANGKIVKEEFFYHMG